MTATVSGGSGTEGSSLYALFGLMSPASTRSRDESVDFHEAWVRTESGVTLSHDASYDRVALINCGVCPLG